MTLFRFFITGVWLYLWLFFFSPRPEKKPPFSVCKNQNNSLKAHGFVWLSVYKLFCFTILSLLVAFSAVSGHCCVDVHIWYKTNLSMKNNFSVLKRDPSKNVLNICYTVMLYYYYFYICIFEWTIKLIKEETTSLSIKILHVVIMDISRDADCIPRECNN